MEVLVKNGIIDNETMLSELMKFNRKTHKLEKIPIVVENATITRALSMMVTKYGYKPLQAKTGADALKIAKKEKPDIVIAEVDLSDMSGFDLSEKFILSPATLDINIVLLGRS